MRRLRQSFLIGLLLTALGACDLTTDPGTFNCGAIADDEILANAPVDTAYININTTKAALDKAFRGVRRTNPGGMDEYINGPFENLTVLERRPDLEGGLLLGLGTEIYDSADSTSAAISFDERFLNSIDLACRPARVLQQEQIWSNWIENIPGANLQTTIIENGIETTYTSDTEQSSDDGVTIDGALILDPFGYFVRMQGSFVGQLQKVTEDPNDSTFISVSGSFIVPIAISIQE